jgi:hypothetical protein
MSNRLRCMLGRKNGRDAFFFDRVNLLDHEDKGRMAKILLAK